MACLRIALLGANGATHAENKTGAVDDVSPAQLRSIAARLSQTLDRYLTSGQTVRIGPLSRAVGDPVRAAEKLATLPLWARWNACTSSRWRRSLRGP